MQCVPGPPPPSVSINQEKHVRTTSRRKKTTAATKTKKTAQQRKQQFKRSKRPVVCVDVDGVLASREYSKGTAEIGEPIDGAVDFTRELHETADIIILTARISGDAKSKSKAKTKKKSAEAGEQAKAQVKDWLDLHGFAYTSIWTEPGKPIASAYVDDRAVACRPEEDGVKAFKLAHEGIDKLL